VKCRPSPMGYIRLMRRPLRYKSNILIARQLIYVLIKGIEYSVIKNDFF
jgi:hypothetical protein